MTQTVAAPTHPAPTVLSGLSQARAWRSTLVADTAHPFFFDHPLDHIPGIMLITGLVELVRSAALDLPDDGYGPASRRRLRLSVWFPRFCELDEPTELRAVPSRTGGWTVTASQSHGAVCLGTVDVGRLGSGHPVPVHRERLLAEPVDGALVHRVRTENILLGQLSHVDGAVLRSAVVDSTDPAHFFTRRGGTVRHPEEVIEAARQLAVLLWPYSYGWPVDVKLSLNSVRADLPFAVDRALPLELRWAPEPPRDPKARARIELVRGGAEPVRIGRFTVDTQAWTKAGWQRLRAGRS